MKISPFFIIIFLITANYAISQPDPTVSGASILNDPLAGIGAVTNFSFNAGNLGDTPIDGTSPARRMGFTVCLGKSIPNGDPITAISGPIITAFDFTYDAVSKCYTATQKANFSIPGGVTYDAFLGIQVTQAATMVNPTIGFTVNSQPAAEFPNNLATDFTSRFTYSVSQPLPVTILNFDAKAVNETVLLNWKTVNETDFSHFEIYKSANLKEFGSIGKVDGGNFSNIYNFIDYAPLKNVTNYYKLKMVDKNGNSQISPIKAVEFTENNNYFLVENPASFGEINIETSYENPIFSLRNSIGGSIQIVTKSINKNKFSIKYQNIPPAIYYLIAENNGEFITKKITIQ